MSDEQSALICASNACVSKSADLPVPDTSKAVRSSYTTRHSELFCNIPLHGVKTQSQITIVLQFGISFVRCLDLLDCDRIKYGLDLLQHQAK